MKIGIMSDSHDNMNNIRKAIQAFMKDNVSVIIHAGDFVSPFTIPLLKGFEVHAVFGNNDGDKQMLRKKFEEIGGDVYEEFFELEKDGVKFGVTHGHTQIKNLVENCGTYDVVVFGHTHKVDARWEDKSYVINPGECCGITTGKGTVVVFDTKDRKAKVVEL